MNFDFTMYTKDNCPYCLHAKRLLTKTGFTFKEIKVPTQASKEDIQIKVTEAGSNAEVRTVPQIFHGESYIGGFTELQFYIKSLQPVS